MKRLDFDVFSLITPLSKPVPLPQAAPIVPDPPPALSTGQRLAAAMRGNRYVLPQVILLDQQVTQGPSPVRYLQVGHVEAPDYAVRKVLKEIDPQEFQSIQAYLWSNGEVRKEAGRWIEIDPPLSEEAESAFDHVYAVLEALGVFRPRTRAHAQSPEEYQ
ncbi:hypothetical protein ACFQDE_21060 [Deinococcus caeni]